MVSHEERRRQWREKVEAQRISGLSDQAYCSLHGLRLSTFRVWRFRVQQQLDFENRHDQGTPPPPANAEEPQKAFPFVRIVKEKVTNSQSHAHVQIRLPGGVELVCDELPTASWVGQLMRDLYSVESLSKKREVL